MYASKGWLKLRIENWGQKIYDLCKRESIECGMNFFVAIKIQMCVNVGFIV
jgi:hypothetical protein